MRVLAIVQARMSSRRFPGKVLIPLAGKPMLLYLIESLKRTRQLDGFVIATSTDPSDLPVAEFCAANGALCFRGPLQNVADRYRCAIEQFKPDGVVRISADSPLLDYRLIDEAVLIFREGQYDLVTNVQERTFPKGQSVEVFRSSCFLQAFPRFETDDEREHVTRYFYRHGEQFRIFNFRASGGNFSAENFCVDDSQGLARCEQMIKNLTGKLAGQTWMDLLSLSRECDTKGATS